MVDGVSLANSHCGGDRGDMDSNSGLSNGDMSHMAIGLAHKATGLASHLPLNRVAHLPGDRVTPLHGNLDGDGEGDGAALGDGLGGAHSLGHLSGHCGAVSLGNLDTDGVGHILADDGALLPGHRGALRHRDAVRDSNTVRLGDGPGDGDADGNLDTVRDRHAIGHLDSPHGLDWHLSALTVNLLLARSGGWTGNRGGEVGGCDGATVGVVGTGNSRSGNSNGGSPCSGTEGKRSGGDKSGSDRSKASEKELGVSVSIGLGISLTLGNPGGEGVKSESSNQRSNSGGGGDGGNSRGASNKTSIKNTSGGGDTSNSHRGNLGSRNDSGVSHNLLLDGDMGLELGADLGDDVLTLSGEAGLWHGLGLGGALLGLCALLLGGALLLSNGPGHVLTLGLCCALGLVTANLISHGLAHLLRHLPHNVGALLL